MFLGLSIRVNANQKVINDLPKEKSYKRDQKLYSLFSIVTFKNAGCKTTSGTTGSGVNRNGKSLSMKLEYLLDKFTYLPIPISVGTCYTSSECLNKGGLSSGGCAAGYVRLILKFALYFSVLFVSDLVFAVCL